MNKFVAPCTEHYGCDPKALELYSRDEGRVDFLKCNSCGIIWRDTTTCSTERVYDAAYFDRMKYLKTLEHRIDKASLQLAMLEEHATKGKLLEIGPAFGHSMIAAMRRGWMAEGVDVSRYIVDYAAKARLRISLGDALHNDRPKHSYDAVIMKHVLEHYKNPFEALQKVNELLTDNGNILLVIPNTDYVRARKLRDKCKFYNFDFNGVEHHAYFNRETLSRILEHTGFEVVQENYPLLVKRDNAPRRITERAIRRTFTVADMDQELIVIARKYYHPKGSSI